MDVGVIRLAIINHSYSNRLNSNDSSKKLDDAEFNKSASYLFSNLLAYPSLSTSLVERALNHWVKISNTKYKYILSADIDLDFIYDENKNTFHCDRNNEYCKKINN